ncbi:uncharacterized protein LOC133342048 isoform X3 [Lethenteron reissneri]|uniref:uncharacterized protein LOC133342048 isoform X3 n=1 Tax=Lethenteron reissneri TaxID=7753 RepID=UPI002AB7B851|nr:uncharacterized protein LOC133342048 isoform X3 [Lethenteron reissneri]
MAIRKAEREWLVLQESFQKLREQLGYPRSEWDAPLPSNSLKGPQGSSAPPLPRNGALKADVEQQHDRRTLRLPKLPAHSALPLLRTLDSEHRSLLQSFVEDFINGFLTDELIPDTLIEVVAGDFTENRSVHKAVRKRDHLSETNSFRNEFTQSWKKQASILPDDITAEVAIRHKRESQLTWPLGPDKLSIPAVRAVQSNPWKEAYLSQICHEIIAEVVREEGTKVANFVLQKRGSWQWHTDSHQQVADVAGGRLLDGFVLQQLLVILGHDGGAVLRREMQEKLLHGVLMSLLLRRFLDITQHENVTLKNYKLKHLHVKLFNDVACDVILDELSHQVEEDMEELHQRECHAGRGYAGL